MVSSYGHSIWNRPLTPLRRGCLVLMLFLATPAWAKTPTIMENLGDMFSNWWNDFWSHNEEVERGGTRDLAKNLKQGSLVIPLLETQGQPKLISGKNVVHFEWKGGKSPYTISVKRKGTRQEVTKQVNMKEIALNLALKKDAYYRVTVRDGKNDKVCTSFKVVANLPSKPTSTELWKIKNNPKGQQYGCAMWLAKRSHNGWAFEAYQFSKTGGRDREILSLCGID